MGVLVAGLDVAVEPVPAGQVVVVAVGVPVPLLRLLRLRLNA
jgi:hypothetical protein